MIVADSDVLIDALAGRGPVGERIALELASGALATTEITAFELRSGARSARAASQVEELLGAVVILPFDEGASGKAAEVRRKLEASGAPIGMADYLIAGICPERSAVLLTRNRAHFERVPGLSLGRLSGGEG